MEIQLDDIGKKYTGRWLYRHVHYTIPSNTTLAITGHNGSGKSTLLQLIFGYQVPSQGRIVLLHEHSEVDQEKYHLYMSFVAPYLELPEELTLSELIAYHFSFRTLRGVETWEQRLEAAKLAGNEHKQIRYFSSGMKQRLKLLLAFADAAPVLLLDEPTSNLDEQGVYWYQSVLAQQHHHRTIVIASNQSYEYALSDAILSVTDYDPQSMKG